MHLLRFTSATKARNALGGAFDAALPTSLVTREAVRDEEGGIVTDRETLPGFWLLAAEPGLSGEVATLGPAGVVETSRQDILGARLDPVFAGMPDGPLAMAEEPEPEPDQSALIAYAADARWRKETEGIVIAGAEIDTDRNSQAMINGAYALTQAAPDTVIKFKAKGGFVELGAAQMQAIAVAVGQHVQSVFSIEAGLVAAIEAGEITSFAEIDAAF